MKISIRDVQVGRLFVKSYSVRAVIQDFGDRVRYRSYDFSTGDPEPYLPGECSKEHITRWAVRECTPDEVAKMKRDQAQIVQQQIGAQYVRKLLNAIPDDDLSDEVRRRGLSLEDD